MGVEACAYAEGVIAERLRSRARIAELDRALDMLANEMELNHPANLSADYWRRYAHEMAAGLLDGER